MSRRFSQKGGFQGRPYRFFNPSAQPFQPCQGCGQGTPAEKPMEGGGRRPLRYFSPAVQPFKPCGSAGCGCGPKCNCGGQCRPGCGCRCTSDGPVYYNQFRQHEGCHAYNGCNMTKGGNQVGGVPTHAPMGVYSQGQESLKFNFDARENFGGLPVFAKVSRPRFQY